MKYTKKYPIHPKPEKQFSGASIFADGGPKTKTYTNKAEYDKALQAYSDSLSLSNGTEKALKYLDTNPSMENWVDFVVNDDPVVYKAWKRLNELNKKSPVFDTKSIYLNSSTTGRQEEGSINLYKKPVVKPEFKSLGNSLMLEGERQMEARYKPTPILTKGTLKQEVRPTMAQEEIYSKPKPINELMMPDGTKWDKQKFVQRYGENQWMKATGQKFAFGGGLTPEDSLRHQAGKTMKYEKVRGSAYGTGLDNYGNPALGNNPTESQAVDWYMNNIAPKTKNYNSAIEKGEAGDFIYNSGKNPEPYQYQEYLKSIGKLKPNETWSERKTISPEKMDSLYQADIAKLPENERRVLLNKGRDWYYRNINKKPDGSPSDAYNNTWYGRIWNTNDYKEFDQNNPKFKPAQKAFGGHINKYFNGGTKDGGGNSFYNQSNLNTSKPKVNTVPSSYTEQFTGYNSTPKTTKDGTGFTKDGKLFNTNYTNTGSGAFSGNYLGMATAAVGGIGSTVNNANAATNEQDKNRAIERGTVDTTMNVVDTAFPIVGAVEGVAGGIGSIIDSTNASTSYTDPNTGKTYNYKKGDSGTSAAGFKAAVDPRGNATNFIGDITGTTENYGQSNFGMAIADLFVPFLSQAFRNKQSEKAANQAQLNNSLINAQGVDSTSRNFSAFGGYKNKFPYGGNMKSEVTGKSYLKDQVSDFGDSSFKTHNEGGVMVDKVNEVEKPEIIWNDYVFSYQLKDKDGIPFSTRARKLIKQIK